MSDNALKPLELAVGIFLTLLTISIGFFILRGARGIASSVTEKVNAASNSLEEGELVKYNLAEVKGSDVVACIKQNGDKVLVGVEKMTAPNAPEDHSAGWSSFTVSNKAGSDIKLDDFTNMPGSSTRYINPNADFIGKVERNVNGVVTQIVFTQKAYVDDASFYLADNTVNPPGGSSGDDLSVYASAILSLSEGLSDMYTNLDRINTNMETLSEKISSSASGGGSSGDSEGLTAVQLSIIELKQTVAGLDEDMKDLSWLINGQDSGDDEDGGGSTNAGSLFGRIDSLSGAIADLSGTLGHLDSENATFADAVENLQKKVDAITENLKQLAKIQEQLDALSKTVGTLPEGESKDLSKIVTSLQETVDSLKDKMDEASKSLEDIKEELKKPDDGTGSTETGGESAATGAGTGGG